MNGDKNLNKSKDNLSIDMFKYLYDIYFDVDWLKDDKDSAFVELWNLTDNDIQKDLIEFLIKKFVVINDELLGTVADGIVEQIISTWSLEATNTKLFAVCEDNTPDGSQALLQFLKNKFKYPWVAGNFFNNLNAVEDNITDDVNIILIDDFIGTGKTIEYKYKTVLEKVRLSGCQNVKVRVATIGKMEFSNEKLSQAGIDNYSYYNFKKGISELWNGDNIDTVIAAMEDLERKLKSKSQGRKLSKHRFGYERSEAYFCWGQFNVPNNVFPIFWWPELKNGFRRKTLFSRL
ncbi:phosphoribosyltransferase [Emticicia sp. TH156]|uniref:phosphoribosyltransferase n=1 Tax=Emticicia sp. TH156 TaxID=2067454 RepID=UPI000C76154B|nr:phosphoribosyltransferase [Emticicia sp. TH156]PLK44357.1 hypothetical protein C0V77_11240 [Emticicia sp. TH156]